MVETLFYCENCDHEFWGNAKKEVERCADCLEWVEPVIADKNAPIRAMV